jgi:hypothetical protein
MMTGAILGGSSVQQAAKLQMIIMFMITASTTLASFFITFAVILVVVDAEHRIRSDRIYDGKHGIYTLQEWSFTKIWENLRCMFQGRKNEANRRELEQGSLLG